MSIFVVFLSLFVFFSKNAQRIYHTDISDIIPNIENISSTENKITNKRIYKNLILFERSRECGYFKSPCTHIKDIIKNLEIDKINNFYFIKNKKI